MKLTQFIDSTYLKTASQANLSEQKIVENVTNLIHEAIEYDFKLVMIRADYISLAKHIINTANSKVLVGTVVGFHEGTYSIEEKLEEAKQAIDLQVDELDFVVNYTAFKKGNIQIVVDELIACTALGLNNHKVVKWIIEVAALTTTEIKEISKLIKKVIIENFGEQNAKNVFVKSSTGFYKTINNKPNGATFESIKIMSENAKPLKIKAAGGVKTKEDALKMISLGVDRIGTSSAKEIINQEQIQTNY